MRSARISTQDECRNIDFAVATVQSTQIRRGTQKPVAVVRIDLSLMFFKMSHVSSLCNVVHFEQWPLFVRRKASSRMSNSEKMARRDWRQL